jgi:hypothetical protein
MAKLSLKASPSFTARVEIPVAGGKSIPVNFNFKHRTKTQLAEWVQARSGKTDDESFLDMVEGWDLEDEFSPENISFLLENYIGSALAVYHAYLEELTREKAKN